MIRFSVDGVKVEFDDKRLLNVEAIAVKKVTGCNPGEFWAGVRDFDPTAWTALVWLARRFRGGETDLRFGDVTFDLMEAVDTLEGDEEDEPADPPSEPGGGS